MGGDKKGLFKRDPPLGIKLLAGFNFLEAALMVIVAIGLGTLGALGIADLSDILGGIAGLGAVIAIFAAAILTLIGLGMWNGEPWAWYLSMITNILGLIMAVVPLRLFALILYGALVLYLYSVRKYFKVKV